MRALITLTIFLLSCSMVYSQTGNQKRTDTVKHAQEMHLKLYPIEADKYVNIYVTYNEPTDFSITLPGSDRNNEKHWEIKAKMTYQQSLDVSGLSTGEYSIILDNGRVKEELIFKVKR
ncbi:MAG: hypothetical protein KDC07_00845 [Chitinophagaceae bacterium]|nr:hypothetical protein [Chitinophagaceae bacterium]MCB9045524.1 hypothetical protein [Chitinophagales bacterium]